jgi:hypothetical protein
MAARHVRNRYNGKIAAQYDAKRNGADKRQFEWQTAKQLLQPYYKASLIDIPVGTGWLFPIYAELDMFVVGYDVSDDMLELAAKAQAKLGLVYMLKRGDIFTMPTRPRYNVAMCMRLLNFFTIEEFKAAVKFLTSVADTAVIATLRIADGGSDDNKTRPHSINLLESTVTERGWVLDRMVRYKDAQYHAIRLVPR